MLSGYHRNQTLTNKECQQECTVYGTGTNWKSLALCKNTHLHSENELSPSDVESMRVKFQLRTTRQCNVLLQKQMLTKLY